MFFFNCFLVLNLNFLSNTIKTESVVVKTDDIIVSGFQMVNPEKKLVTVDCDYNVLRSLPANSLLKKVSEKKPLLLGREGNSEVIDKIFEQGVNTFYFLARDTVVFGLLFVYSPYGRSAGKVAILTSKKYHEWLTSFSLRSSLDEPRKRFLYRMYEIIAGY